MKLSKEFFSQDAETVAKSLLGMNLVRKLDSGEILRARIVETEAYFGKEDPASRACKNGDLKKTMEENPGTILVYGVHNNWLINFVTGKKGKAEAVLLRALEPLNFNLRTTGPGLLTKALQINKKFHKDNILNNEKLWLESFEKEGLNIVSSFRIGVRKDLKRQLRFYIKGNKFVSRK